MFVAWQYERITNVVGGCSICLEYLFLYDVSNNKFLLYVHSSLIYVKENVDKLDHAFSFYAKSLVFRTFY